MVASERTRARRRRPLQRVSIPFIAGQWSLRENSRPPASGRHHVSIPFIAGQWSLPACLAGPTSQTGRWSQSPSLRGSGRFGCPRPRTRRPSPVSIPFIAGQWSLQAAPPFCPLIFLASQSPSLRGSGRFVITIGLVAVALTRVSIPFIAGQWSLLNEVEVEPSSPGCLNPLHCGAVVASAPGVTLRLPARGLNPLHCGAVVASLNRQPTTVSVGWSQSPSLRGSGRFTSSTP